jgi:pSer/pThr/pTyr-binding forkhead associated (FHA) protein
MARLRIKNGPLAGQTIEVENELVIGREDSDLALEDLELSRRHAIIRPFANRLQVEDLGSSNGTFVDGARIEEPTLLGGGAEIKMGTTVLVVEGVLPVTSPTPEAPVADVARAQTMASVSALSAADLEAPDAAAAAPLPQAPAVPLSAFHPPAHRRQRGLASRSWVPVALSFGTVILVAIALVIYFATR